MDISACKTSYEVDEIYQITLALFVYKLKENTEKLESPYSKPQLFSFYEDFISYPIDDLKDDVDEDRLDFYELISLMSWALYRMWVRKVLDDKSDLDCFHTIIKSDVIDLFIDNLSCDEGMSLLEKVSGIKAK